MLRDWQWDETLFQGSARYYERARLSEFEHELRAVLAAASPSGLFAEQSGDTELRLWRKPQG